MINASIAQQVQDLIAAGSYDLTNIKENDKSFVCAICIDKKKMHIDVKPDGQMDLPLEDPKEGKDEGSVEDASGSGA